MLVVWQRIWIRNHPEADVSKRMLLLQTSHRDLLESWEWQLIWHVLRFVILYIQFHFVDFDVWQGADPSLPICFCYYCWLRFLRLCDYLLPPEMWEKIDIRQSEVYPLHEMENKKTEKRRQTFSFYCLKRAVFVMKLIRSSVITVFVAVPLTR